MVRRNVRSISPPSWVRSLGSAVKLLSQPLRPCVPKTMLSTAKAGLNAETFRPARDCARHGKSTSIAGRLVGASGAAGWAKGDRMADRSLRLEQTLAMAALAIVAAGCFLVMRPFLSATLWALIFAAALWRPFGWLSARIGRTRAALVLTVGTAVLTMIPLGLLAARGAGELAALRTLVEDVRDRGMPQAPSWVARISGDRRLDR